MSSKVEAQTSFQFDTVNDKVNDAEIFEIKRNVYMVYGTKYIG